MLKAHFDAMEEALIAQSEIAQNSGHNLHKGTPREWFIRNFLSDHLGENIGLGSGEIIDSESKAGEDRNQFDIIVYRMDYPKLRFGGGIDCFLAESVVATIEVKSFLEEKDLKPAVKAAAHLKGLRRNVIRKQGGYIAPAIASFIVAFDGPAKMKTILGWLPDAHKASNLTIRNPNLGDAMEKRVHIPSASIDGVFILGRGFLKYDNMPISLIKDDERKKYPNRQWEYGHAKSGTLLEFFVILNYLATNFSQTIWDPLPYLRSFPGKVEFV